MKKILLAFFGASLFSACSVENIIEVVPVMITYEPQNILTTSASMGGITMSEGGNPITEHGIVIGTNDMPTTADNKISVGSRIGDYYFNYEGLAPGTTYYYRAFGTNLTGTGYGDIYNFTTQEQAPCEPSQDNYLDTGLSTITIDSVEKESHPFTDGNIEFQTLTNNSTTKIFLGFKELDQRLPLTGTYTIVDDFLYQAGDSQGTVTLLVNSYIGWEQASAKGIAGDKIYVENTDGVVTFIFCDLELSNYYTLNGKFSYTE